MTAPQPASSKSNSLQGLFTLLAMAALTLLVYFLYLCVHFHEGALVIPDAEDWARFPLPTLNSAAILAIWLCLHVFLQFVGPGKWCAGTPLADGSRLQYRMNGLFAFWFSLGLFFLATCVGWLAPTLLYDEFGPLLTTTTICAFAFSFFLYVHGTIANNPARGAGNPFHDFFLGVTLNPRFGKFDLKFFLESRPGLIGWVAINYSLAAQQFQVHGRLSTPMCLVFAFQILYVADYFWHEEGILTTWDVKHEKLGWMLVWGDLVWVPSIFTLQAHYLISHAHELPMWATAGIVALNLLGYSFFRGANWQKHQFRKDPDLPIWGKKPEYIRTRSGSLLLTSGWWGIARHLNYLGDLMMALAWCLFEHPLPYFYFVYFLILLLHRERRDHATCLRKYGPDWEKYCQKVRWRILPFVY